MYLKSKNVLVVGLGITGVSAVKTLDKLEANIYINDSKSKKDLQPYLEEIKNIYTIKYLNGEKPILTDIDLILKSPGVPPDISILHEARNMNIEIITDLEMYYRIKSGKNLIAISGTNGKTTTTKLTGEIFEKGGYCSYIAGNIGIGILDNLFTIKDNDILIVEASSFQLEDTVNFKPYISAIINLTPDHISWHGNFENYINSKKKIATNQKEDDYTVLNYDDKLLRQMGKNLKSNIIWFSVEGVVDEGTFIEDEWIVFRKNSKTQKIIKIDEIQIPGKHNLENILASVSIAILMGVSIKSIKTAVGEFKGVEHRIEYVDKKNDILFYNDSKGTNPDSTIKAISALKPPIILIAGGYDKGSEYEELINSFNGKIKELVLLGETRDKIKKVAMEKGFNRVHLVDNMKEAVKLSYELGESGDIVLLSPACASWGMYSDFEERGRDFKNIVESL